MQLENTILTIWGGLYHDMPVTAACCLIGVLSLSTVPLLSDFASKYLIFNATVAAGATFFTVIAFLGCLLNVAIAIRLLHSVFMRKAAKASFTFSIADPPSLMLAPMILASAALVVFGVAPTVPLNSLVIPAVKQIGFPIDVVAQPELVETPLGFWNPSALSIFMILISVILFSVTLYSRKVAAVYRKSASEETLKPFLCGEDLNLLDGPLGHHFYHALANVLRVNRFCHASNVDRAYNALSTRFSSFTRKMLRLDIQQDYFAAVASFLVGAIIIVLVAVFWG